jgi:PEP-CTERM motif
MLPVHSSFLKPVALAALLSGLSLAAQAQVSVTVLGMTAEGSYQLGGDPVQTLSQTSTTAVDVVEFPFNGDGYSAVLHSYGDDSGNFGSRSSGVGIYDVTGSYSINLRLVNGGSTAQRLNFGFHITPGYIYNSPFNFADGQFVKSSIGFEIKKGTAGNLSTAWSTSALLSSDSNGVAFSQTESDPNINLFVNNGNTVMVQGNSYNLDLGVLDAGASLDLSYQITTAANGNAVNGTATTVPGYTVHVPEQWVEFCSGGYGYGGYGYGGYGYGNGGVTCSSELVPAHDVFVEGYTTFAGQMGSSQAGSGDPFDISSSDGTPSPTGSQAALPPGAGLSFSVTAVPEPGTYALMALGLLGVGLRVRRKR